MINIKNDTKPEILKSLCNEINMPIEVTEQILNFLPIIDYKLITPFFGDLFTIKTGHIACKSIHEYCNNEQNGIKELTIYLIAALYTREQYKKNGIDDSIFIDTMKIFSRFVYEHQRSYGTYGFDRWWWIYRNLSSVLFRLGQLEFELHDLGEDIDGYAKSGDYVLSVHIPSDAVLTRKELNNSYQLAEEFFVKYFSEFPYKAIICSSWLLSYVLKELLPVNSKILDFQSDFDIISYNEKDTSYMEWVFKQQFNDFSQLPEDTSLQRNIKRHVMQGGKIGSCFGVYRK